MAKFTSTFALLALLASCMSPGEEYKDRYRNSITELTFYFLSEETIWQTTRIRFLDDGSVDGDLTAIGFPACRGTYQWKIKKDSGEWIKQNDHPEIWISCSSSEFGVWAVQRIQDNTYTGKYAAYTTKGLSLTGRPLGRDDVYLMGYPIPGRFGGRDLSGIKSTAYTTTADQIEKLRSETEQKRKAQDTSIADTKKKRKEILLGLPKGGRFGDGYQRAKWGMSKTEFEDLDLKDVESSFYFDSLRTISVPINGEFDPVIRALTAKFGPVNNPAHTRKTDSNANGDFFECEITTYTWDDGITEIKAVLHKGNFVSPAIGNACNFLADWSGIRVIYASKFINGLIEKQKEAKATERL